MTEVIRATGKTPDGAASLLGLSFAFMGVLKLAGLEQGMFRRWGLTPRQMRVVGVAETAGALMVARRETRTLGAAGLTALVGDHAGPSKPAMARPSWSCRDWAC